MKKKVLSALLFSVFTTTAAAEVTLINPFVVPDKHSEAVLEHWEQARDFLQTQPGYISTSLHRSIQPNSEFYYINVAKWQSEADFKSAIKAMHSTIQPLKLDGVKNSPALYEVIRN